MRRLVDYAAWVFAAVFFTAVAASWFLRIGGGRGVDLVPLLVTVVWLCVALAHLGRAVRRDTRAAPR